MDERTDVIKKMARESYLDLAPAEVEALVPEVSGLLDMVDVLASLPVEPGPQTEPLGPSLLRPDETAPCLDRDDALANAPASHDGFVAVPRVITAGSKGEKP